MSNIKHVIVHHPDIAKQYHNAPPGLMDIIETTLFDVLLDSSEEASACDPDYIAIQLMENDTLVDVMADVMGDYSSDVAEHIYQTITMMADSFPWNTGDILDGEYPCGVDSVRIIGASAIMINVRCEED